MVLTKKSSGVRGVVRDIEKSQWIKEHFDKVYSPNNFELLEVKDMAAPGALDSAVKGCQGFVHLVSDISWAPDPNIVVNNTLALLNEALRAAAKEPGLKRFVYTSTAATAMQMRFNEEFDLTQDSWNEKSVKAAWAPPPYTPDRGFDVYAASKAQAEKALWEFVSKNKPQFEANTVLPDFVTGASINSEKQGLGPTEFIIASLWKGEDTFKMLGPHWMVDTGDVALLHVGALLHPDYKGQRIFGYAHRKNWTDWIARLRRMYPQHKFPGKCPPHKPCTVVIRMGDPSTNNICGADPPENEGSDLSRVVDQPKAEALLKWLGQPGWRPMEDSMRDAFDRLAEVHGI